jgi:putative ABC transport system permease protein
MSWLHRLANVVRRRDLNTEIDEELQFHVDEAIRANLAAGMTEAQARRDALRRFGSRAGTRERTRDANVLVQLERLWQDFKYGTRAFARNPSLTAIAVASIALGTGANVAVFSVADALLLRPPPIARPDSLLAVGTRVRNGPLPFYQCSGSYLDYLDLRAQTKSFDGLALYNYDVVPIRPREGDRPRVRFASFISDNFFSVLGVDLALGRAFRPDETTIAGAKPIVVLSDALWRSEFNADANVIGRKIRIAALEFEVVGVAPASFTGLHAYVHEAVFIPIGMMPRTVDLKPANMLDDRQVRVFSMKARLRPGITLPAASAELAALSSDFEREYPATNTQQVFFAETDQNFRFSQRPLDTVLVVLLTLLSTAVLCVACANVAGLLASRGPVRAREMALRLAVGASRGRLVRQLLTESLGIALLGGAGGLLVSRIGIALLRQIRFSTEILAPPRFDLDERTLLYSILIAVASTLLVGLGPAVTTTRVDLTSDLKSGDRSGTGRPLLKGRSVLVAGQVALSLVLLTIAGFTVQLARREIAAGPGFRTTHVAKITMDPGQARYSEKDAVQFFSSVLEEARAVPGVRMASLTASMPLNWHRSLLVLPEGQPPDAQPSSPVFTNSIEDRFFETMDIGVVAGRVFTPQDDEHAPAVAIVNDTLARQYWPDESAVGKRLQVLENPKQVVQIVGVVKTTKFIYLGEPPLGCIFFPYRQRPRGQMVLVAQTLGDSAAVLGPLRDLIQAKDKDLPIFDVHTIETFYEAHTTLANVAVRLIAGMGVLGMGLTMVGLYGLVSYAVSRRTREIGIRIAIGATYIRIVRMVLSEGMTPAWIGVVCGLILSAVTAKVLPAYLPVDNPVNMLTFYLVVPLLVVVTLLAAFVPARRAARVSPTVALRCE